MYIAISNHRFSSSFTEASEGILDFAFVAVLAAWRMRPLARFDLPFPPRSARPRLGGRRIQSISPCTCSTLCRIVLLLSSASTQNSNGRALELQRPRRLKHLLYSPGSGHSTLLEAHRLFKHRLLTHTIYQKCCSHACSLPQKPSPLVRWHSKTRSSFGFALENSTPETYIRTARG